MAYVGLVPSERSSGPKTRRGGITKTGNGEVRKTLIEAAWTYRRLARISEPKQRKVDAAPKAAREIAWKAQVRLCARYRRLAAGKPLQVVVTAIAREMLGFVWAIGK
jgi:transposase